MWKRIVLLIGIVGVILAAGFLCEFPAPAPEVQPVVVYGAPVSVQSGIGVYVHHCDGTISHHPLTQLPGPALRAGTVRLSYSSGCSGPAPLRR